MARGLILLPLSSRAPLLSCSSLEGLGSCSSFPLICPGRYAEESTVLSSVHPLKGMGTLKKKKKQFSFLVVKNVHGYYTNYEDIGNKN